MFHRYETTLPRTELFRVLLVWLGIPVLLAVAGILVHAGFCIRQEFLDGNKEDISLAARRNQELLHEKISAAHAALSLLGSELRGESEQHVGQRMAAFWESLHAAYGWAEGLGLRTANRWITAGRFPADAPGPDAVISTVPDAAFHITDAHTGPDGLPHFYIATALGPDRFLCLAVNARLFNAFLEEFRLGRTGEVFLINAEGVLQSRSVLHGALLNRVDGLAGQSPDKVYARTWGGTRLWSAVLPVTAHSGWRIVAQWDEREMTQSADARLIPLAGGGVAVFLVLVCAFGLTTAKIAKSQRKSAERQRQSEEQRMLVRKLDSIGQLGTGIAHEINNPLAIIGEEAGWMQDVLKRESIRDTPDAGDLRNALRQITLQTARCREVTHKLLIFGGRAEGTVRDVDLSTLIADTLTLRRRDAAQKNVEVEEETAPMPRIHTEPSLLRQVLLHLMGNALDAMPQGGRLAISSGPTGDGSAFFRIRDTGFGIPEDNLPRIFDPFFTTKDPGKGAGLGLSICHGILQRLGGSIRVDSKAGQGTTVTVVLPREARPREDAEDGS